MRKKIVLENNVYYINTDINSKDKKIHLTAFKTLKSNGSYTAYEDDRKMIFYEDDSKMILDKIIHQNSVINFFFLGIEKRLAYYIKRSIKLIHANHEKEKKLNKKINKLRDIDKNMDAIFNLDEYLLLETKED